MYSLCTRSPRHGNRARPPDTHTPKRSVKFFEPVLHQHSNFSYSSFSFSPSWVTLCRACVWGGVRRTQALAKHHMKVRAQRSESAGSGEASDRWAATEIMLREPIMCVALPFKHMSGIVRNQINLYQEKRLDIIILNGPAPALQVGSNSEGHTHTHTSEQIVNR